jgi:dienelactone hydrolase
MHLPAPGPSHRLTRRTLIAVPALGLAGQSTLAQPASPVADSGVRFDFFGSLPVQYDTRFHFSVHGLESGQVITIEATFSDARDQAWKSAARYVEEGFSTVSPVVQVPESGSFDVADSMAFIWAATTANPDAFYAPPAHDTTLAFRVLAEDGETVLAHEEITRTGLSEDATFETIDGPDFRAEYVAPPTAAGERIPAVMILGGSEGGISTTLPTAIRLAASGYACLAVGYFGMEGLPDQLENISLEYFADPIEWLNQRPEVEGSRIAVLGYSRGAELALLLGTLYEEITAAVSISGSGVVHPGIDWNDLYPAPFPAWTWNGSPLPFIDGSAKWDDPDTYAEATIPIENINGPVLLVAGDDDWLWPSVILSQIAWRRLQTADRDWPDQFLTYPGAGHLILPPFQPLTYPREFNGLPFGGNPRDDAAAGAGSWQAILAMLGWWRFKSNPA